MILKAVLTGVLIVLVTAVMGEVMKRDDESRLMSILYGFIVMWAFAFAVGVPLVIAQKPLSLMVKILVPAYCLMLAAGIVKFVISLKLKRPATGRTVKPFTLSEMIYLGLFIGIVGFQLYKTIFYAYGDGDDSFYVASAAIAEASDKMYLLDAYIGIPSVLPYRYAFAPFPMWEAMLARVGGIDATSLLHTVLPPILIAITYILYNELSKLIFGAENREKRYMFLTLTAVFEMFSNVSTSTSGTFMLTRARQGKEALACIVLPFVFYELFRLAKEDGEAKLTDFFILLSASMAAALSSLLGNILVPIMLAGAVLWMIVKKKRFKNILLVGAPVIVNIITVLWYLKIK